MGQGFVSFRDLDKAPPSPTPAAPKNESGGVLATATDVASGAVKGAANTAIGLGDLFYRYVPGVGRVSDAINGQPASPDAFGAARREFATPTNTAQKVGFGAEQVGEFLVPTGAVGAAAKAAEVGKAALLTTAQGGSPTEAGISAGISAVVPGARMLQRGAEGFEEGANKAMSQALGATKESMKATAADLAPQMLERGVKGSRQAMLAEARTQVARVGSDIGQEIQRAAAAGATVDAQQIRGAIQAATQPLMVTNAGGKQVAIEGTQAVVAKLGRLDSFVKKLGPDIPFDKAAQIKTAWDHIVSKSGLYGAKATASATDNASAWAIREGADAFRGLLAQGSPTIADLNQEYAFWKGMRNVLAETERRTQAQAGGLVSAGMGGAGAIVGGMTGDSTSDHVQNAIIGGMAGRQLIRVIQSPAWRTTVTGPMKQKLADALASGNAERVTAAVGRIVAAVPARYEAVAVH